MNDVKEKECPICSKKIGLMLLFMSSANFAVWEFLSLQTLLRFRQKMGNMIISVVIDVVQFIRKILINLEVKL